MLGSDKTNLKKTWKARNKDALHVTKRKGMRCLAQISETRETWKAINKDALQQQQK